MENIINPIGNSQGRSEISVAKTTEHQHARTSGGLSAWRKQKRQNGTLYRQLVANQELLIALCDDTFRYGADIGGNGYVTKQGLGKNYVSKNPDFEGLNVNLETGWYHFWPSKDVGVKGDFYNCRAMAKKCSREDAIGQILEFKDQWEKRDHNKTRAEKTKNEKRELLDSKDVVFKVLFEEGKRPHWCGTQGELKKALEEYYGDIGEGGSLNYTLQSWEASGDVHRFTVVTSSISKDKKTGWVRLRRFKLTPTGIDTRWEEARAEASKVVGVSDEERAVITQRYYERSQLE